MFPVYMYDGGSLPTDHNYYVVAGNGVFFHKTGIVKGFVPVKGVAFLDDLKPSPPVCTLPPIPASEVLRIQTFFSKVVEEHRAEAIVLLYFNEHEGQYKIHAPEQFVSHGSVKYDRRPLDIPGYVRVGTIHSHCDFQAFNSGTDVHDEEDFDGLHCTFGHNDKPNFSIFASVAMNGVRCRINPAHYLAGLVTLNESFDYTSNKDEFFCFRERGEPEVSDWMAKVWSRHRPKPPEQVVWNRQMKNSSFRDEFGDGPFRVKSASQNHYTIETPKGDYVFHVTMFEVKK